jgi:hypothetical protein
MKTLDPIDRHALLTRIYEYPPERDRRKSRNDD